MRHARVLLCLLCLPIAHLCAGTVVIGGLISQSTLDGTGPASGNPSLNNIQDLQAYTLTLQFTSVLTGPGSFDLTGSSLVFDVAAAPASEAKFDGISLTITADGTQDDFSLLGCIGGADCSIGNALSANFSIPAAGLFSTGVAATGLDQPHPLDLLEDDGITDIQGSITSYSGIQAPIVPEPSSVALFAVALTAGVLVVSMRSRII